jgi:hypothetical protein
MTDPICAVSSLRQKFTPENAADTVSTVTSDRRLLRTTGLKPTTCCMQQVVPLLATVETVSAAFPGVDVSSERENHAHVCSSGTNR